jgi:ABC-2 type transport system ATP-binding protein
VTQTSAVSHARNIAIDIRDLTRRYGSRRGIDDVRLAIPTGSLYGFLGPNGAGKTTTIRVLLGFLRATSGSATILGLDAWRDSAQIKAHVGAIPGDVRLWSWLSGNLALRIFGQIRGVNITPMGRKLADELELDLAVKVRAMSRGMRQKLGLILALAHNPRVLILDEPTTALDPLMQDRLRAILRRMANAGSTVFFSSHTLSEVEDLCERVAIVRAGRIVADSTLDQLRATARHDIDISWPASGAPETPPAFLKLTTRTASRWVGTLDGDPNPLLAYLSTRPVADVRIAKPDLETLFRRYYDDGAGGAPSSTSPPDPASLTSGTGR